jgi:hypothetical protein
MAGRRLKVTLGTDGIVSAAERRAAVGIRGQRPEPALRAEATRGDLQEAAGRRFRRGLRRSTNRAWTLEKQRRGMSTRVMHATGESMLAVTRRVGPRARAIVFSAFNRELRWGVRRGRSSLYHLQVHASGYRTTRGRVPPRRVVVLDKKSKESIAERVVTYVETGRIS